MSTRSSIFCPDDSSTHLFEDVAEGYKTFGLHLDIRPGPVRGLSYPYESKYGDFAVDGNDLHLRIPVEVCEAIADFVIRRRTRNAEDAP